MRLFRETDIVVIGGGIAGTAILLELSKYELRCLLVEKETGLSNGITDAKRALQNGAQIICDCAVTGFVKEDGVVTIVNTTRGAISTKAIINTSDACAEEFSRLFGEDCPSITSRHEEFNLFDETAEPGNTEMLAETVGKIIYLKKKRSEMRD